MIFSPVETSTNGQVDTETVCYYEKWEFAT